MSYSYSEWIFHGEKVNISRHFSNVQPTETVENEEDEYDLFGMLNDVSGFQGQTEAAPDNSESDASKFFQLFDQLKQELYPGCEKLSSFLFLVKLMHIKSLNGWSNKSFDMLLQLLKEAFPEGSNIPVSTYDAKSKLKDLGLGYELIHVCKYDCALFWKEHKNATNCPVCGEPRYKYDEKKRKNVPHKILRYFSLIPRLKRLFMSKHTAADMRWHKEKRLDTEGVMTHPADSIAWKDFDEKYPWFADDARNVRMGLASDGFNPFGNMSTSYSMWPVVLVPYNLPPWMFMKEPFFIMSLLIPGPKAPGKDFDVYLRPLIDELKELWADGVETWDVYGQENFRLHASVLWTVNDFPAYGTLSGWSTKGYKACPVCNGDTTSKGLRNKICYMGHRRFLPVSHSWRKSKLHDGTRELRGPPRQFSGDDVLNQLNFVKKVKPGKNPNNKDRKRKRTPEELNWTKKSIFFELPYWSKLKLRHNLDVMHIEKNIFDNVIGTLLGIDGKTKDTEKARLDLADMNIRKELHLKYDGNKWLKPPAAYTMTTNERKEFCVFLNSVKFPDGYAANISRNVNITDGKISGLKSHDCHVMLQRLLPVGIRKYLPKDICAALIELSNFFQQLCAKKLVVNDLEKLEKGIVLILCKLERIFPPAFFDIMVHLAVHLPREAILAGPVNARWMYPFER